MLIIGSIGFITSFFGKLAGLIISNFSGKYGKKFEGGITAFTAGLLIAFICFEMLEQGFLAAPLYMGVAGMLLGVILATYLDGKISCLSKDKQKATSVNQKNVSGGVAQSATTKRLRSTVSEHFCLNRGCQKSSLLVALGVAIHNFPEGIALGSMCAVSLSAGLKLAAIIAIHCIPEATAIFLPMRNKKNAGLALLLLTLPMAIGSVIGVVLTGISDIFLAFSLTFASGVMLYITTGEILPESRRLWNGRLTTVCAAIGFILGVVITA